MTTWNSLTPVQADAVLATARSCQTDPDELLDRLLPLLTDEPIVGCTNDLGHVL
jgi:hypothetical protein